MAGFVSVMATIVPVMAWHKSKWVLVGDGQLTIQEFIGGCNALRYC